MEQRELHAEKYMKLQNEITNTGKSTLANLHQMVNKNAGSDQPTRDDGVVQQRATRAAEAELEKASKELEYLRDLSNQQLNQIEQIRAQQGADKRAY